jgi:small conductance mechanosensitive channel
MANIDYVKLLIDFGRAYGTKILSALFILSVGFFVARWIGKAFDNTLRKRNLEPPVRILLVRVVNVLVVMFALLLAVQNLGIEIMPIVAGIGVAGVGIGFAAQGVLGNALAGLTIIFSKPYRVGEYIELLGVYGEVVSIELFSTALVHADNSRVIVPNRKVVGEILHNYGAIRQCNLSVGIAYTTDVNEAIAAITDVLKGNALILKDPEPIVGVTNLADSSIQIAVRPWVKGKDYVTIQSDIYQDIINSFRAKQISIPFPQQEIRILGNTN